MRTREGNSLISITVFFSLSLIFLIAPFVLSVTTANHIFFLRQSCREKLFDVVGVWKGALRELPSLVLGEGNAH